MNLKTRRILITGGSSGIGLALGRALADDNRVVVAGRDPARLERAAAATPGLRTVRLDVTSEEQSRAAVGRVVEELGGIDILVHFRFDFSQLWGQSVEGRQVMFQR